MLTNSLRIILLLIIAGSLASCGYQLKGTRSAELAGLSISLASDEPYGTFEKLLSKRLKFAGVELTDANQIVHKASEKAYQIELVSKETSEQGVSRDATGRASEAILTTRIYFRLRILSDKNDAQEEVHLQKIEESTNYTFDYRDPIARKNQRREAHKWLQQKLVDRLLQRIERQLSSV